MWYRRPCYCVIGVMPSAAAEGIGGSARTVYNGIGKTSGGMMVKTRRPPGLLFRWKRGIRKVFQKLSRRIRRLFRVKPTHPGKSTYPRTRDGINIRLEMRVFNSVNFIRKCHGSLPLSWDERLYALSQQRAKQISWNFSHEGCPAECGENIAEIPLGNVRGLGFVYRQNIPRKFVSTWMNSPRPPGKYPEE